MFCEVDPVQLMYIILVLTSFETMIGLKVNMTKSEMIPIGELPNLPVMTDNLCCQIGELPMNYLHMPLGSLFKSVAVWNPIIEKI